MINSASNEKYSAEMIRLVRADPWIMELLDIVRNLGLADWCIAAGAVRNLVWDHLHGYTSRTYPSDIDVLFYDRIRTDPTYESEIEKRLSAVKPDVRWEAVNQATVHQYTRDPRPYASIEEAMSRWADPVTAVGVRLTDNGQLRVIAPFGLDDLFNLIVRPNLVAPDAAAIYQKRVTSKDWHSRWPKLKIILPQG
jgi:hypothetical protein